MKRRCDAWLTTTNGNDRTPKGILSLGGVLVVCVRDRFGIAIPEPCVRTPRVCGTRDPRGFPPEISPALHARERGAGTVVGENRTEALDPD